MENKVTLANDDPRLVEALIRYCYGLGYGNRFIHGTDQASMLWDLRVCVIADKYLAASLMQTAWEVFSVRSEFRWDSPEFVEAVAEVYATTIEGSALRKSIVRTVCNHTSLLDGNRSNTAFLKVLRETPDFGVDILIAMHTKSPRRDIPRK